MTMRIGEQLSIVCAALAVALLPGANQLDARPEPPILRLGKAREQLMVLSDGNGHYLALHESGDPSDLFYGKGRSFYRQRVSGFSSTNGLRSYAFWAPAAMSGNDQGGVLSRGHDGRWILQCGDRETELEPTSSAEQSALLQSASFHEESFQRRVRLAARDEDGTYYVLDSETGLYDREWRLFVGKRGKVAEVTLLDVVSDSGGDVFASKRGDLSFERRDRTLGVILSKGSSQTELTFVPPELNVHLFYVQMGIYGSALGTPCDEL